MGVGGSVPRAAPTGQTTIILFRRSAAGPRFLKVYPDGSAAGQGGRTGDGMTRLVTAAALLTWVCATPAAAQQVFRSGVETVRLGVAVVDKAGQPVGTLGAGGLHGPRGRPSPGPAAVHDRRARGRRAAAAAHRPALRHLGQHGGRPGDGPQRGRQVLQHAPAGRGHHAGGLRHRGPGGPLRPGRLPALRRAPAQPQAGRLDGPVRRAGRLPRRHVVPVRREGPGGLHRWRATRAA